MKYVNCWYVDSLLGPLAGLADVDEAWVEYQDIDPNDEIAVRIIIKTTLVPNFNDYDQFSKNITKLSLSYCLTKSDTDFADIFNAHLLPFDPPDDARLFFIWLWQELFGNESYQLKNINHYQENNDINMTHTIKYHSENDA